MKNKFKLAIRGAYGEGNFGDDALQYYLHHWTKDMCIETLFLGKKAKYIETLIPNILYKDKCYEFKYQFDYLLLGGGTQFFSFKAKKQVGKLDLLKNDPRYFLFKLKAFLERLLRSKHKNQFELIALGIGIGPFEVNSDAIRYAQNTLKLMDYVFVRNKSSYDFASQYTDAVSLATDICFLPGVFDFNSFDKAKRRDNKVAVIVRDWNFESSGSYYLEHLLTQIKNHSDSDYDIDFIAFKKEPHSERYINSFGYSVKTYDPQKQSLNDFLQLLSSYGTLISARFHGIIFGSLLNIPSIAIEIEPKLLVTKEMLQEGVKLWRQPFSDNVFDILESMDHEFMKNVLKERVKIQSESAIEMFSDLNKHLKSENGE